MPTTETREQELARLRQAALDACAASDAEVAQRDVRMKREGWTHRVTAWSHPAAGGDDFMFDVYFVGKPTKKQIEKQFRDAGSCVFNDFQVVVL